MEECLQWQLYIMDILRITIICKVIKYQRLRENKAHLWIRIAQNVARKTVPTARITDTPQQKIKQSITQNRPHPGAKSHPSSIIDTPWISNCCNFLKRGLERGSNGRNRPKSGQNIAQNCKDVLSGIYSLRTFHKITM